MVYCYSVTSFVLSVFVIAFVCVCLCLFLVFVLISIVVIGGIKKAVYCYSVTSRRLSAVDPTDTQAERKARRGNRRKYENENVMKNITSTLFLTSKIKK